ncbi:MAG: right-handed parallel beta-helix repeat-containing protein [Planctomycetota bacterium]|jgi:parallel beta-helix repeat protein
MDYKRIVNQVFVGVAVAVLAMDGTVRAETPVGGMINADTTWYAASSPYVVTVAEGGSIVVGSGATLTIEPGVVVRFEPLQSLLVGWSAFGPGTLVARGTEQSPILFTSDQPEPAPGDWMRIDFLLEAADAVFDAGGVYQSGCILEHAIVEYAGASGYAAVNVEQSAPFLSYCEVRGNLHGGIVANSADAMKIENCHVHDNLEGGMSFDSSGHTLTGNTITDNSGTGMYFYYSDSNTLTGNTISGNGAYGMYFDRSNSNTLSSNTIAGNTSSGMYVNSSSSNTLSGNTITDNSASYGGGICLWYGGGHTLTGNTITDNTSSNYGGGIYLYYGNGYNTLTGNTIAGNSASNHGGGIYLQGSGSNTLTGNTIEDNTAGGEGGAVYLTNSDNNDPFASNIVRFNHTTSGQTGGIFVTNGSEWFSLNGGTEAYNTIFSNDGYELYNDNTFHADGWHDIDAANVYWCTHDTVVIRSHIYDFFDDSSRAVVLWDPCVEGPPGDLNGDSIVNIEDFLLLLAAWGSCPEPCPPSCPADFDGNCTVNVVDFLILLANWG